MLKTFGPVALIGFALMADLYHRNAVSNAFYNGFDAAKQEAQINDTFRAGEIRNKAAEAGFVLGTDIPRPASERVRGVPNPNDTRGYRD